MAQQRARKKRSILDEGEEIERFAAEPIRDRTTLTIPVAGPAIVRSLAD